MLARIIEQAGISTVIVTMMPAWSERLGAPRTLGVEHPYGQPVGPAGDRVRQREVFRQALGVLEHAQAADHVEHSDYQWPGPDAARRSWHPPQPSPIVAQMTKRSRGAGAKRAR